MELSVVLSSLALTRVLAPPWERPPEASPWLPSASSVVQRLMSSRSLSLSTTLWPPSLFASRH